MIYIPNQMKDEVRSFELMVNINSTTKWLKNDVMFFELIVDINSTGNQLKNDVRVDLLPEKLSGWIICF